MELLLKLVALAAEFDLQGDAYVTGYFIGETDFGGQAVNVVIMMYLLLRLMETWGLLIGLLLEAVLETT